MQTELKKLNFNVTSITDASKDSFEKEFEKWVNNLSEMNTKCVALFHASGHGLEIDDENYLVPVDAKKIVASNCEHNQQTKCGVCTKSEVKATCISLQTLLNALLDKLPPGSLIIFLLDCCRDDPGKGLDLNPHVKNSFAKMQLKDGGNSHERTETFIGYATAPGKEALSTAKGCGGRSPFTDGLIKCLANPVIVNKSLVDLFTCVRSFVQKVTTGYMEPKEDLNMTRCFRFSHVGAAGN